MSADQIDALLQDAAREREAGNAAAANGSRRGSGGETSSPRSVIEVFGERNRERNRERDRERERDRAERDRARNHNRHDRRRDRSRDRGRGDRERAAGRLSDPVSNGEDDRRGVRGHERKRSDRSRPRSSYKDADTDEEARGAGYRGRGDFYSGGGRARSRSPRGDRFRPNGHRGRDDRDRGRYRDREEHDRVRERTPRKATPEPTEDERDRRTIFVQQLAARLRTRELAEFFSKVGPVKEAQIVKDRVSGRSKGVGYVEFKDEESVAKALELTGQKLAGIPIIAQLTEAEKNRQARQAEGPGANSGIPFHRLYVGNIHFSIGEEDLNAVFSPYGELEFVQLQKEEGGRSKGYGFVQFRNAAAAKHALEEMNGFEIAGRPIRVGLGNDKFTPETTENLKQRFNSNMAAFQGSSFSGAGGRGAQAGGAGGTFDRATARDPDRGAGGASALDDTDVAGVNFNNYSRESLMMKLARRDPSTALNGTPAVNVIASSLKPAEPYTGFSGASRCIRLSDVFKAEEETEPDWAEEIEVDIRKECEAKFGKVLHINVDQNSTEGEVWIMFEAVSAGQKAVLSLNGRLYGGQNIRAAPVAEQIYRSLHGRALNKVL